MKVSMPYPQLGASLEVECSARHLDPGATVDHGYWALPTPQCQAVEAAVRFQDW